MPLETYLLIVAGMGAVTFGPRWAPLFFLTRRRLPDLFVKWLELIPAAILSALLAPALVTGGFPRHLDLVTPELVVAIPTFAVAIKTRSLGGTVIVGMGLFWLVSKLMA